MTKQAGASRALLWRLDHQVLEVELCHPPCNEIGRDSLAQLEELVAYLQGGAHGARAVLLASSMQKGFCAGADLRALQSEADASDATAQVAAFLLRIHAVFNALDALPLPTVAAVHGFCFGGGLELALTCDVRIADRSARFALPELRLGLIPGFGGIPRLQRELGTGPVLDLLLTGRSLGAARAYELGLVSQLVGRGEALNVARQVARQATRFDPATVAAAKSFAKPVPLEALQREQALFLRMFESPVVRQALQGFVERTDALPYLP